MPSIYAYPVFVRESGKQAERADAVGIGGFPPGGKSWEVWEVCPSLHQVPAPPAQPDTADFPHFPLVRYPPPRILFP
jgi:hypothetical protein